VSGTFPPPLLVSNTTNMPCGHVCGVRHIPAPSPCLKHHKHALWACLWCLARSRPFPLSRTPQTHPCGRVCGVWCIPAPPLVSNTKNAPTRACFWCPTHPSPSPRLEHPFPFTFVSNANNTPLWACFWCMMHPLPLVSTLGISLFSLFPY